ncbi:hypothetical protein LWI29_016939 [Acer saccharum]|uniref:DUF1985 domain-containing protein n=1 Tax=Acer saccharum TaxID=4024 RepID=A0AA39S250_ACESA|nr:hypothetical protein LWI29_016939 [Acer saccharum]
MRESVFNCSFAEAVRRSQHNRYSNEEKEKVKMPPNPKAKLWCFPDHKEWVVNVRVNSQSKKNLITDIKEVLTSCGMVQRFKERPFGSYLDLPQPSKIHGILIHNLLKWEVIIPEQREDEIWLDLGRSQVCFGKEEFCLCSGLKMGSLPQGFTKKKAPEEGSLLNRHFKEKRPTADLLYATMKRLTSDEGEDVLKMASIFMINQFFGTDDGRKAIPGWMFALVDDEEAFKKFPWGSYIYSITLFWLKRFTQKYAHTLRGTTKEEDKKKDAVEKRGKEIKGENGEEEDGEEENEENEHEDEKKETETETKGQQVNENEESKGQQVYDNKEGGQPPEITEHGKEKKKKSKYHTLNIFGFTLAFQEESSDEDQDQNLKLDGVDESMYNHRTTASFVSSPDDPPSKKKLFYDTDFQTHKSTVHTLSPPSTIVDLYSAIASLIKESDSKTVSLIKESEERQLSCFRAELNKIREEIKVGDTLGKKSTKENSGTSNQKNDKVSEELLFKQAEKNDVEADATCNVTAMEESVGQDEAASKSDGVASKIDFEKHSSDPRADAPAVSKMVEDVDNRTILDENELKEINNCVEFFIQEIVQEGRDQEPKLNQIIQTLEGLRLQMDANQKANMAEFTNLNHRMDAFQKALVQSGHQFPYVHGQTNGSENTPQQAVHETTSPLLEP